MPYYRQISGEPTTLCVGDAHWMIDGATETPEIPAVEDLVAAGSWERSSTPFPKAKTKAAIKLPDEPPAKAPAKPKKKGA